MIKQHPHPSIHTTSGVPATALVIYEDQYMTLTVGEDTWIQCEDQTRHWPWTVTLSIQSMGPSTLTVQPFTLSIGTTDKKGHYSVGWVTPTNPDNPNQIQIAPAFTQPPAGTSKGPPLAFTIYPGKAQQLQCTISQAWVACSASEIASVAVTYTVSNLNYTIVQNTAAPTIQGTVKGVQLFSA